MISTIFPKWPHLLFAVIEPIGIIIGWSLPLIDLPWFINQSPTVTTTPDANISTLAYQLSNIYGVTFLLSIGVCYATTEPKVLRSYVIALGIGDVGHFLATYLAMGHEVFVDVARWNFLAWANFAFSVFLLVNRIAYLLECLDCPRWMLRRNWLNNYCGQSSMVAVQKETELRSR